MSLKQLFHFAGWSAYMNARSAGPLESLTTAQAYSFLCRRYLRRWHGIAYNGLFFPGLSLVVTLMGIIATLTALSFRRCWCWARSSLSNLFVQCSLPMQSSAFG